MGASGGGWKDLEFQLGQFLAREAKREREGKTIEKLFEELDQIREEQNSIRTILKRVAKDRLEDKFKLEVHGRAIKTLQAQVELLTQRTPEVPDWRPDASEITGMHVIKDVQKAQEELEERLMEDERQKRENATWWKRQGWIWVFAIFSLFVGGTMNGCMQLVIRQIDKVETPPRASNPR